MTDPQGSLVDSTSELVMEILHDMGIADPGPDSVLVAPESHDGAALLGDRGAFDRFMFTFCLQAGCIPYSLDAVALLTLGEFCELHVGASYPPIPTAPLAPDQYALSGGARPRPASSVEQDIPIAFVLGCGRSGTTLFRTMLNVHDRIWAPGELHLATFAGMADRAAQLAPPLRYGLVSEVAARLGESKASFSERLASWEREDLPVSEVYDRLHVADPQTLIVDKTPTYSARLEDLEAIGEQFCKAKFVHIVRNPHDVIRSFVRMQLYKGVAGPFEPDLNPYQIGEIVWYVHNSNIATFLRGIPDGSKCTVRYESLVADPAPELTTVCRLLDLPFDPAMADPYAGRQGRVARGAGDARVNLLDRVEQRPAGAAFYSLGETCRALAEQYGY